MLVYHSRLINTPVLSIQTTSPVGFISDTIVNPDNLKIVAFRLSGPLIDRSANVLLADSIREYSNLGIIIDSIDELINPNDVIKISKIISLNFDLTQLKVETKKGSKLGQVIDFTVTDDNFLVQQIIVRRPMIKRFIDPELTISRHEIVEVNDYKIIVKDEEKTLKSRAAKEDFVPNFVNPFREAREATAHAESTSSPSTAEDSSTISRAKS